MLKTYKRVSQAYLIKKKKARRGVLNTDLCAVVKREIILPWPRPISFNLKNKK